MDSLEMLFDNQKGMSKFIMEKKGVVISDRELMTDTLLALSVEVGELANEIRSFKYWSKQGQSDKAVILEEYVDVLNFFLTLGNLLDFKPSEIMEAYFNKAKKNADRAMSDY